MKTVGILCGILLFTQFGFAQEITTGRAERRASTLAEDTSVNYIEYAYFTEPTLTAQQHINREILLYYAMGLGHSTDLDKPLNAQFFDELLEGFRPDPEDDDQYGMPWALKSTIRIEEYPEFYQLIFDSWAYKGGVHGNGNFGALLFDKSTGARLHVEDLVTDEHYLRSLFEAEFRRMMELPVGASLDEAGFWFPDNTFTLNDNFYFDKDGMNFYFNTYEIASYAQGPIELHLSYEVLKTLFSRTF